MSSLDQEDPARALRVERAIDAAKRGDSATALGILAGMSAQEREAYGSLITGFLPPEVVAFLPEPATSR
jgi:hypothetical protein